MAIHTSAIFYRRGIPNNYNNFAFVAQTNNVIPQPMYSYVKNYNFINRNISNTVNGYKAIPWKK